MSFLPTEIIMFPYKNNFCRGTFFMADFNSNFNDIQKQIAVADLTEEQIQELMNALQTRRNAKPKLTTEELAFFQCCREHRSYANDKDLDAVVCPHCGSVKSATAICFCISVKLKSTPNIKSPPTKIVFVREHNYFCEQKICLCIIIFKNV